MYDEDGANQPFFGMRHAFYVQEIARRLSECVICQWIVVASQWTTVLLHSRLHEEVDDQFTDPRWAAGFVGLSGVRARNSKFGLHVNNRRLLGLRYNAAAVEIGGGGVLIYRE